MRKSNKMAYLFFVTVALFFSIECAKVNTPIENAGNDSGIDNCIIAFKLYAPDGKTPARGAHIQVRYWDYAASFLSDDQITSEPVYETYTDDNGIFRIDTIQEGLYTIVGSDNEDNKVLIDSLSIISPAFRGTYLEDTLKPSGQIQGVVKLTEYDNYLQIFALALGVDRFCQIQEDGRYLLDGLPEGNYRIKFIALDNRYFALDTNGIVVKAGETTWLDTIVLFKKNIIPVPKDVIAEYDSVTMDTRISWSVDMSNRIVKGYNVYRISDNRGFYNKEPYEGIRLNSSLLYESGFTDTTIYKYMQCNFEPDIRYYVTIVDTNGRESIGSVEYPVTIKTSWVWVDSTTMEMPFYSDIKIGGDDHIHILASVEHNNAYIRYDGYGKKQAMWYLPDSLHIRSVKIVGVGISNDIWLLDTTTRPDDSINTSENSVCFYKLYHFNKDGECISETVNDSLSWRTYEGDYNSCVSSYNCRIIHDTLFYVVRNNNLSVINLINNQFSNIYSFDSTLYADITFSYYTENELLAYIKSHSMSREDQLIRFSLEGEPLSVVAAISNGDTNLRTRFENNKWFVYTKDYVYVCSPQVDEIIPMPCFGTGICSSRERNIQVLSDGTVHIFITMPSNVVLFRFKLAPLR